MKKLLVFSLSALTAFAVSAQAPNTWTQKANVGFTGRSAGVGFSIGSKGYIGTGTDGAANYLNDLWEYDPITNTWAQKASIPSSGRSGAAGFSIGSKGYIGAGTSASGYVSDFWEYDQTTNTWTQKANFAGGNRQYPLGLSIGNKGYMGTGQNDANVAQNDFWEYDPATNTWTQKASLGTAGRFYASAFTIGQKGYVGLGFAAVNPNDLWEYDPANNTWIQKANFTGTPRAGAVAFAIGQKAYLATGHNGTTWISDVWEYDLTANNWTQQATFPGGARAGASGFSIGQSGYLGTGYTGAVWTSDFWAYAPPAQLTINTFNLATTAFCPGDALDVNFTTPDVFNSGNVFTAQLSDASGSFASPVSIGTLSGTGSGLISAIIPASTPAGTMYKIRVVASSPGTVGPDTGDDITISAVPVATFSGLPAAICVNAAQVPLTATLAGGNFTGPGITGSDFNAGLAGPGTHTITYTVSQGSCTNSTTQQVTVSPLPATAISGLPAEMCSYAGVVTLTGAPAGGIFSGTGISGNQFDPAAAGDGSHTITYTVTTNGCTNASTQQVLVTHVPPAGVPSFTGPVCTNHGAMIFSGSLWVGTWSGPGMISNVFDPELAGPGLHTITHTVTNGNCSTSDSVQVEVVAAPSAVFTHTNNFTNFTFLTSVPATGNTYSWNFGDGNTSTMQNPVHTYAAAGTFTVTLTVTNAQGCTSSSTQQVTSIINGLAEDALAQVTLYPNPAGNYIRINNEAGLTELSMALFNITGQKVLEQKVIGQAAILNISALAEGAYVAKISASGYTKMHQVIISR